MNKPVIKIENLSKQYQLGYIGAGTLRGDFQRWHSKLRGMEDPFTKIDTKNKLSESDGKFVWALKDINLEVHEGEVLGIIGKNGAGKSTLLKILSRVTGPTKGTVKVRGIISSLLEVGTGFHPELTGRENIFLNGAILGMTKFEIKAKLEEIVEFSGIAKYLDTPVKRYSSGMHVRLAFAVAAHLDPDILIIDEVLAVGDAEFQQKAIGKMQDVSQKEGRTVLFVSHNMASIESLCTSTVLLKEGSIIYKGENSEVINKYLNDNQGNKKSIWINNNSDRNLEVELLKARITNKFGDEKENFFNEEEILIEFTVDLKVPNKFLKIGFELFSDFGKPLLLAFHNDDIDNSKIKLEKGINILKFRIPAYILNHGTYSITANSTVHKRGWIYVYNKILSFNILFKLNNTEMQINKRPSILAPILECTVNY